mmetsp:Transcript_3361/g.6624  ORF Transcript_3361/g.6624 Transcript_3361/m.6624 type:complete len:200 (-) Transcript_3361:145-744(-)
MFSRTADKFESSLSGFSTHACSPSSPARSPRCLTEITRFSFEMLLRLLLRALPEHSAASSTSGLQRFKGSWGLRGFWGVWASLGGSSKLLTLAVGLGVCFFSTDGGGVASLSSCSSLDRQSELMSQLFIRPLKLFNRDSSLPALVVWARRYRLIWEPKDPEANSRSRSGWLKLSALWSICANSCAAFVSTGLPSETCSR